MSATVTQRTGDGTVTIAPKNEALQSALVVLTHGLGDTAEGFADVAESFAQAMPHIKFILPTAPTQPVTMNGGMPMPSWYDLKGLDERSNEQCTGIQDSRSRIQQILEKEHATTGLSYQRMLLAGFSQGGALSLFSGMQMPTAEQRLAGIVVMSGYLPNAASFKITPGLESTPIWHGHGQMDMLVNPGMATRSKAFVEQGGATDYTLKTYPIAHSVSPEELAEVQAFLQQRLPVDESHCIKLKEPTEMSVKELKAALKNAGIFHKTAGFMEKSEFVQLLQSHRDGKL